MTTRLLDRRSIAAIMAVEMTALGSLVLPLQIALPLAIRDMRTGLVDETALSVVAASGALVAMIAAPILGGLSDRTRHRGAGRAIWIVGGAFAGALALLWTTQASGLTELTVGWCAAQFCYNATFSALFGLIGDHTDATNRSTVSGLFGASAVASVVLAMGLATVLPKGGLVLTMTVPAIACVVATIAFYLLRGFAGRNVVAADPAARESLRGHHQFWLIWTQRLLAQLAYGLVVSFGLYFLIRRVHLAEDAAADWVAVTSAAAAVISAIAAVTTGRLVRGRSYRGFIAGAMVAMAAGSLIKAFGDGVEHYVLASLIVAAALGCYSAVDLALVLRVVPSSRSGRFLGIFNIARTLPQSLAPAIAPMALALGDDPISGSSQNYLALFVVGAVAAVIATTLLPWIRVGEPQGERPSAV